MEIALNSSVLVKICVSGSHQLFQRAGTNKRCHCLVTGLIRGKGTVIVEEHKNSPAENSPL